VSVALLKPIRNKVDVDWLTRVLNSPLLKQQSEAQTMGVGNKNLVLKFIRAFTLPLPPLAEQKRIVAKADQLMVLCDDLETKLNQAQQNVDHCLASIVYELIA
jgi:type I restriction enzyme S subunit